MCTIGKLADENTVQMYCPLPSSIPCAIHNCFKLALVCQTVPGLKGHCVQLADENTVQMYCPLPNSRPCSILHCFDLALVNQTVPGLKGHCVQLTNWQMKILYKCTVPFQTQDQVPFSIASTPLYSTCNFFKTEGCKSSYDL